MSNTIFLKRFNDDINQCGFNKSVELGFYFFMGFVGERFSENIGIGNSKGYYDLFPDSHEDKEISCDDIRRKIYTIAKLIDEISNSKNPLSDNINIGHNFVFTGEIESSLFDEFSDEKFSAITLDNLYTKFFECIGDEMISCNVLTLENVISQSKNTAMWWFLDDQISTRFVVDKLLAMTPPLYKALLYYPINYSFNKKAFDSNSLFSNVLRFSLENLPSNVDGDKLVNDSILKTIHRWHQFVFYDDGEKMNPFWDFKEENLISTLLTIALHSSKLVNHIPDNLKLDFKKKCELLAEVDNINESISVKHYTSIIDQLMKSLHGYDLLASNWLNKGLYIQVVGSFYINACLFSVYPTVVYNKS